jgi:hypothetical protein
LECGSRSSKPVALFTHAANVLTIGRDDENAVAHRQIHFTVLVETKLLDERFIDDEGDLSPMRVSFVLIISTVYPTPLRHSHNNPSTM